MEYLNLHSWEVNQREAIELQAKLKERVSLRKTFSKIEKVAGADVSYCDHKAIAGVVVLSFPCLKIIERQFCILPVKFPYIPGLLTFREGPVLLGAFKKVRNEPDVVLFDGQGIAHPRRIGIATHLGLFLDRPTIGCAKSKLSGNYPILGEEKGSYSLLREGEEILGAAVRTKKGVNPIFVSPGNKIDLFTSVGIVLKCTGKYKLPEPAREAHLFVNKIKRELMSEAKWR
ncbi:MAG: deoxyribonuclease V [Candidatus Aerophobetes bacterium]|nr:deoxyribonuclease V [Candidatus Aerophobetes bacterium]